MHHSTPRTRKGFFARTLLAFACFLSITCPLGLHCLTPTANANTTEEFVVLAGSDFQHPSGPSAGKQVMQNVLNAMKKDGITQAEGFLFCGDYDYDTYANVAQTTEGVNAVKSAVQSVVANEENIVLIQGNHDTAIGTSGMSGSGNNDPKSGKYGVFAINEDDYMQFNGNKARIQETAQALSDYLNDKLNENFEKPIFVLSHLPLHYTGRTTYDGDGRYAHYIFDVLNEAGEKGLDIFFLYGHNHSNGWEDYLGGASVFMTHGDNILVPQGSQEKADCANESLNFTVLNAGYTGYYSGTQGVDSTLSMTAFKISGDSVSVLRYDQNGKRALKSEGVSSDASIVNKKTYDSPQIVALQAITDFSPIQSVISVTKVGNKYRRIDALNQLFSGNRYLLIANIEPMSFALPSIQTKANQSGSKRTGLDLETAENVGWQTIYGEYTEKEWTLISKNGGWLLSNGAKYLKLTSTNDYGVTATLEDEGDIFTIAGSGNALTFSNGTYVLNYNSRGVINGYDSSPVSFMLYELSGHLLTVTGGSATVNGVKTDAVKSGQTVQISAPKQENKDFEKWIVVKGNVVIQNETEAITEFVMPAESVTISAQYTTHIHEYTERFASPEFLKDGTSNVYYTSCLCGSSSKGTAEEVLFGSFRITAGKNAVWEKDTQADGLAYKTNANDELQAVKVNGTVIASDAYTVANDGTITLKASYLNTLADGNYQLRLSYALGDCSTTFAVQTPDKPETPAPEVPPTNPEDSQKPDSSASSSETSTTNKSSKSGGCASSVSTLYASALACVLSLAFIVGKRKLR